MVKNMSPLPCSPFLGPNFLRCTKILSQRHPFMFFSPTHFYHVNTHLWMIMMESKIIMVYNIVLVKILITFDSLFFMGIKI
jgi:hypothetical protein